MSWRLVVYRLKRYYHFVKTGLLEGLPAQVKTGFPQRGLTFIVITGTDGKTTTTNLVHHILKTAGKSAALISTVGAKIGDQVQDTGFHVTSPGPNSLYRFLKQIKLTGQKYVVLEVTSHGSYQFRTWGIRPTIAGVTNITHEHLDYHVNYEEYVKAKANIIKNAKTVFLNEDDQSFNKIRRLIHDHRQVEVYTKSERLSKVLHDAVTSRFVENFNQMNARLAIKIAQSLGIEDADIAQGIKTFSGIPGRMEEIPNKSGIKVVVDFAHTPQGLESALTSLKQQMREQKSTGRLIAVYGCAGLRDRAKRPMMGEIGTNLADIAIFTAEDPRTEDVWSIIRQMKEQLTSNHRKIVSIANRGEAINFALTKIAKRGDVVGIFGKGHEKSMCYGTTEYPWSDQEAVRKVFNL